MIFHEAKKSWPRPRIGRNGKVEEITSSYKMDEDYYNAIVTELINIRIKKLKGGVTREDIEQAEDRYNMTGNPMDLRYFLEIRKIYEDSLKPVIKKDEKIEKIEKEIEDDKKKIEVVEAKILDIIEEEKKIPKKLTTKAIELRLKSNKELLSDINRQINNLTEDISQYTIEYTNAYIDDDEDELIRISRLLDVTYKELNSLVVRKDNLIIEIELENKKLKKSKEIKDNLERLEKEKMETLEKIEKNKQKKEQEEQKSESRRKLFKELDQKSTLDEKLRSLVNIDSTKLKKRKNIRK